MRIAQTFLALSVLLLLAACGGGGGGGFGTNASAVLAGYSPVYATAPDDINPADEMDESVEGGPGATGVMAVATMFDGSPAFHAVKIRALADGSKLYISIDGGAEIELDETPSGAYGTNPPTSEPLVSYVGSGNSAWLQYTKLNNYIYDNGEGVVGIETPVTNLPDIPAKYTGDVTLFSYNDTMTRDDIVSVFGTFDMDIDFNNNTITGTTGGTINTAINAGAGQSALSTGTISGSTAGNGLVGTMTFNSSLGDATVTFAGKTYGWSAEEIGGAAIGTITNTGDGTIPIYGQFTSD